jgi:hypothetical protein
MKTIYLLLSTIFFAPNVIANSNDSLEHAASKKNEIGLLLNPVGIVLLGSAPSGQRLGVSYKHKLKQSQLFLTSGIYYQGRNYQGFERENEITLEVNGLLRNIQYNKENNNKVFAGLGVEKRWIVSACPKVLFYVGAEFIMAYGAQNTNIGNQWMKTDSIIIAEIGTQYFEAVSDYKQTKEVNKTSIAAGFQTNAGLQLHLNKRFYLFAQTAPSFLISSVTQTEKDFTTNNSVQTKSSNFDFDMRALVSDVGLFYKF